MELMDFDVQIAADLQILADFCGPRDIDTLTPEKVRTFFQGHPADVIVLFGGSILHGADLFASALQNKAASASIIVGGYGHTTAALQEKLQPVLETTYPTEAESFQAYLDKTYGIQADFLETQSTNCGNNITLLLALLEKESIPASRMIFIQDASMQKRMGATLAKYRPDIQLLHFASSKTAFGCKDGQLVLENSPAGMWDAAAYARLLMGEILRLQDNEQGYGPAGKNFIAHVEIPEEVLGAWQRLAQTHPEWIRQANPAYATALAKEAKREI